MKLKFSSGKASIARRSRQADGCDAVEELEPINQNLQIDFKFQVNWRNMQSSCIMDDTDHENSESTCMQEHPKNDMKWSS